MTLDVKLYKKTLGKYIKTITDNNILRIQVIKTFISKTVHLH